MIETTTERKMKVTDSKSVIESIRKKLEKQKNQGKQNENSKYRWSPKAGEENRVRILPYPHGVDPFTELYFHYNLPGKPMCPKLSFPEREERCAICEFAEELLAEAKEAKNTGNKNNSAWEQYKKMAANNRAFAFILIRGKEQEGPKCWGISQQNYTTIQNWFINPEFGDLSNVLEGIDLVLTTTQDKNKKYPSTVVTAARNNSRLFPATNDKKADSVKVATFIASIPKIEDVYPVTSYEETKKILDTLLQKSDEHEEESQEAEETTLPESKDEVVENQTSTSEEEITEESSDIDDLLADLEKKK